MDQPLLTIYRHPPPTLTSGQGETVENSSRVPGQGYEGDTSGLAVAIGLSLAALAAVMLATRKTPTPKRNSNTPGRNRQSAKRVRKPLRQATCAVGLVSALGAGYASFETGRHDAQAALPPPVALKAQTAMPAAEPKNVCDAAAWRYANGDPVLWLALTTITRNETGASPRPWAIMANGLTVGGNRACRTSSYGLSCLFENRQDAENAARGFLTVGYRNIDIGCFQVNLRWHGHRFNAPPFDPDENAEVAVAIFKECRQKTGDFMKALGCYHSGTPDKAERYTARAQAHLRAVLNQQLAARD